MMTPLTPEHRKYLEEALNVRPWFGKSRYTNSPIKRFAIETLHVQGWVQHRVWREDSPPGVSLILRQPESQLEQMLSLNVWECESVPAAHEYLLNSLAQMQSAAIERDRASEIGDILFRLNDTMFIFARANLVVLVRNVGPHVLGIAELANTIDLAILRRLALGPVGANAAPPASSIGDAAPHAQPVAPQEAAKRD